MRGSGTWALVAAMAKTLVPKTDLEKLMTRLLALPDERVRRPSTDVSAAATFALGVAGKLAAPALDKRLRSLPKAEFDPAYLDDLRPCAQAALEAAQQRATTTATAPSTKVSLALAHDASAQRERMLRLLDYYFAPETVAGQEVAGIRLGRGYLDLAEDLDRLAALYTRETTTVSRDTHLYQADDARRAADLAKQLRAELGEVPEAGSVKADGRVRKAARTQDSRELCWRAFALLEEVYAEVAAAVRFVLRHEGGEALCPSLHTAGRHPNPSKKPEPPKPAPKPAP